MSILSKPPIFTYDMLRLKATYFYLMKCRSRNLTMFTTCKARQVHIRKHFTTIISNDNSKEQQAWILTCFVETMSDLYQPNPTVFCWIWEKKKKNQSQLHMIVQMVANCIFTMRGSSDLSNFLLPINERAYTVTKLSFIHSFSHVYDGNTSKEKSSRDCFILHYQNKNLVEHYCSITSLKQLAHSDMCAVR